MKNTARGWPGIPFRPEGTADGDGTGAGMDRPVRQSPGRRYRAVIIIALLAVLAGAALALFMPAQSRALRVDRDRLMVSEVVTGQFDDFIPVRAQVTPLRTVYLDTVEGGRVEEVLVEAGVLVGKGDPIVTLSNTALQLDVISREAQVAEQLNNLRTLELELEQNRMQHERDLVEIDYQLVRLRREVDRLKLQSARGAVPRANLEDAMDELAYYEKRRAVTIAAQDTDMRLQNAQLQQLRDAGEQLQASLKFARRNLERLNVKAPMDGKLTALDAEVGQSLAAGQRLGQVDDPDSFKLSALVDEYYLGRIAIEQSAQWNAGDRIYLLRVSKIYPQVNNNEFRIDMEFDGPTPAGIRRGQTLQLKLYLGGPTESVLIPNGAFYEDTGGDWVFVMSTDNRYAVRRDVSLGRRNLEFIEVRSGLEPGERVITSPYTNYLDMHRLSFTTETGP